MRIIRISLLLFWSSCAALIAQPSEQLYQLLHLDELVEIVSEEGLADANATADAYLQGVTRGGFGASIAKIYEKKSLTSRVKAIEALGAGATFSVPAAEPNPALEDWRADHDR